MPSYDIDELLNFCDVFNLSEDEVRRRCSEIGPAIGNILGSKEYYEASRDDIFAMANQAATAGDNRASSLSAPW